VCVVARIALEVRALFPQMSRSVIPCRVSDPVSAQSTRRKQESTKRTRLHSLLVPDIGQTAYHHIRELIVSYGPGYGEGKYTTSVQRLVENAESLEVIRFGIMSPYATSTLTWADGAASHSLHSYSRSCTIDKPNLSSPMRAYHNPWSANPGSPAPLTSNRRV
jgi:hypothetical protein